MHNLQNSVLIVVDVQKGFSELCPNELPTPKALEIIPVINRLLTLPFKHKFASLDWHPENHTSFKIYPKHCIQNTTGSEFLPNLHENKFNAIFRKGYQDKYSYSMFDDHEYLKKCLCSFDFYVCGLVENICVYETARDCKNLENNVYIIEDACAIFPIEGNFNPEKIRNDADKIAINYIKSKILLEKYENF